MPRNQTEAFFDEVGVALELAPVWCVCSRHRVLEQLILALIPVLMYFFLLLLKDVVVLIASLGVQVNTARVIALVTAALVHELLGELLRVFPFFILVLKVAQLIIVILCAQHLVYVPRRQAILHVAQVLVENVRCDVGVPRMHIHISVALVALLGVRLALLSQNFNLRPLLFLHLLPSQNSLFVALHAVPEEVVVDVGREVDLVTVNLREALKDTRFENSVDASGLSMRNLAVSVVLAALKVLILQYLSDQLANLAIVRT